MSFFGVYQWGILNTPFNIDCLFNGLCLYFSVNSKSKLYDRLCCITHKCLYHICLKCLAMEVNKKQFDGNKVNEIIMNSNPIPSDNDDVSSNNEKGSLLDKNNNDNSDNNNNNNNNNSINNDDDSKIDDYTDDSTKKFKD